MTKRSWLTLTRVLVAVVLMATWSACTDNSAIDPDELTSGAHQDPTSHGNITPSAHEGNFVASDDIQVCYELAALGIIDDVTGDMRGFKVNIGDNHSNSDVSVSIHSKGIYLDWQANNNADVVAFIVKGGPNYHVYDYVGSGLDADSYLSSPVGKGKKIPAVSHYNVCYTVDGDAGCTPGYWRNHADRWIGVTPDADFDDTFGVDLFNPNITLGQAIWLGGGGANALARHATAALLNSYGGKPNSDGTTVAYAYTTVQVIQMVQDAVSNGTIDETKNLFEAANEAGCPLNGTPASKV
jgi:hypothetical protein